MSNISAPFIFVDGEHWTKFTMDEGTLKTQEDLRGKHVIGLDFVDGKLSEIFTCDGAALEAAWRLGMDVKQPYAIPLRPFDPQIDQLMAPKLPIASGMLTVCSGCEALYFDKDGYGVSSCQACMHHNRSSGMTNLGRVDFFPAAPTKISY